MFLINNLRLDGVNGVFPIIDKHTSEDIKQILIAMSDKAIYVSESFKKEYLNYSNVEKSLEIFKFIASDRGRFSTIRFIMLGNYACFSPDVCKSFMMRVIRIRARNAYLGSTSLGFLRKPK